MHLLLTQVLNTAKERLGNQCTQEPLGNSFRVEEMEDSKLTLTSRAR